MKEANQKKPEGQTSRIKSIWSNSWLVRSGLIVLAALVLSGAYYGYLYFSTPTHLRYPQFDHYHFRTQIIVDGQAVDFSHGEFQEDITADTDSCSIAVNGTPVDFHDGEDQMTHIHWGGMTGGEFLKYFGWNFIGGQDDSLGRRYDFGMMNMHSVDIKGDLLPAIPESANFYVYVGDENGYEQKSWDDFLNLDLEDFFGKYSNINASETSYNLLDLFSHKVYAHGGVDDEHQAAGEGDEQVLEELNNIIGNVVIFVQDNEPTAQQLQERFSNLVPVHASTCGG